MKKLQYILTGWMGGFMLCLESPIIAVTGIAILAISVYKFGKMAGIDKIDN